MVDAFYESKNEIYINEYKKYQALYEDVEINNTRHHEIKPLTYVFYVMVVSNVR